MRKRAWTLARDQTCGFDSFFVSTFFFEPFAPFCGHLFPLVVTDLNRLEVAAIVATMSLARRCDALRRLFLFAFLLIKQPRERMSELLDSIGLQHQLAYPELLCSLAILRADVA
jgi:hypothetical protein